MNLATKELLSNIYTDPNPYLWHGHISADIINKTCIYSPHIWANSHPTVCRNICAVRRQELDHRSHIYLGEKTEKHFPENVKPYLSGCKPAKEFEIHKMRCYNWTSYTKSTVEKVVIIRKNWSFSQFRQENTRWQLKWRMIFPEHWRLHTEKTPGLRHWSGAKTKKRLQRDPIVSPEVVRSRETGLFCCKKKIGRGHRPQCLIRQCFYPASTWKPGLLLLLLPERNTTALQRHRGHSGWLSG